MEAKKLHRTFTGTVVSAINDKTITVLVTTYKKHSLYNKRVISSKKVTAHDELNQAKVGNTVKIMECRPLSRTKKFRLVEIIEQNVVL